MKKIKKKRLSMIRADVCIFFEMLRRPALHTLEGIKQGPFLLGLNNSKPIVRQCQFQIELGPE